MADDGQGTTIAFATSTWSATITNVDHSISRDSLETTHLGTTTAKTFMPADLQDSGEVELELQFDSDNVSSNQPPYDGAVETITITFPVFTGNSNGATAVFSGFMTNFRYGVASGSIMTASATLKVTGDVTWTDGT